MPAEEVESIPNRTRKRASQRFRAANFRQGNTYEVVAMPMMTLIVEFDRSFWSSRINCLADTCSLKGAIANYGVLS